MNKGDLFWVIIIIAVVFGGLGLYRDSVPARWGFSLVLVVLLGLLGWATFGQPVK